LASVIKPSVAAESPVHAWSLIQAGDPSGLYS